jgi:vancomycin resistance protein YoaR
MSTYHISLGRSNKKISIHSQEIIITLLAGGLIFFFFIIAILFFYHRAYNGKIFPGVSIAGFDLSRLEPVEAIALLEEQIIFPKNGKIVFQDGDQMWVITPKDLGLIFNVRENVKQAYYYGRGKNPLTRFWEQFTAWYAGEDLAAELIYDESIAYRFISDIANEINQPVKEASLEIQDAQVFEVPGQVGREVDIQSTLLLLRDQISILTDGIIPIQIIETRPKIEDVSQAAILARQILSEPLILNFPDESDAKLGPWVLPPEQVATKIKIEKMESSDNSTIEILLDEEAIYTYLKALAPDIDQQSRNARFIFNDETRLLEVIQPAIIGRSLDIYSTIQDISKKILAGEHSEYLTIVYTDPEITDDTTGEELGITELVSSETTYFRGSTNERMQNIQTAAANFHGLLVPPGTTFSMAANMKSVSLDNGYAEALIIYGDRTIKGVGGGVCQVSTTLFRTAFFGGFPIVERHPHAYRVGYYEQSYNGYSDELAGLDATVYVPVVDFKFTNNTPYWLLMETYFNPTSRSLTWKFYSTSDGRSVEWETTGPINIVESPDPVYEENPDLAKGDIVQVDWAADGADVTVSRFVYRDGQILFSDSFSTYYLPWGDIYQYGPGTKIPKKFENPFEND